MKKCSICCRSALPLRYAKNIIAATIIIFASSCEKPYIDNTDSGIIRLTFIPTGHDATRMPISHYFTKLNVQLFDTDGNRVFDKVKTQTTDDPDFATMSLKLSPGSYTVVAVGHSSKISATIKSPEVCQFTASDGEKLTDTFCHVSTVTVSDASASQHTLDMYRAVAMVQFCLSDDEPPANFAYLKFDYTGGSANFNPTTLEGITKSTQSETRIRNSIDTYQAFTFPYLSNSGTLKMTVSATDTDGTIIRQRTFEAVTVTRNRITTYVGPFFADGDGEFIQSDFGFVVHADWDGEDFYEF